MAYFENRQWAVTDWGLEAALGATEYLIPADRLLSKDGIGGGTYYDGPLHMGVKTWIGIDAFNEAFKQALQYHRGKYRGEVDQAMLRESLCCTAEQAKRRGQKR